jgi:hypothetical protein
MFLKKTKRKHLLKQINKLINFEVLYVKICFYQKIKAIRELVCIT